MTPSAALKGNTLYRMFPEMKLLHLVRDGRDVACSVLRMPWGPNDLDSALDWWARRLEQGFAATPAIAKGCVSAPRIASPMPVTWPSHPASLARTTGSKRPASTATGMLKTFFGA